MKVSLCIESENYRKLKFSYGGARESRSYLSFSQSGQMQANKIMPSNHFHDTLLHQDAPRFHFLRTEMLLLWQRQAASSCRCRREMAEKTLKISPSSATAGSRRQSAQRGSQATQLSRWQSFQLCLGLSWLVSKTDLRGELEVGEKSA